MLRSKSLLSSRHHFALAQESVRYFLSTSRLALAALLCSQISAISFLPAYMSCQNYWSELGSFITRSVLGNCTPASLCRKLPVVFSFTSEKVGCRLPCVRHNVPRRPRGRHPQPQLARREQSCLHCHLDTCWQRRDRWSYLYCSNV
jgi:hypothetical protein